MQDGFVFQMDAMVDNLRRNQASRDVLVNIQGCVRTDYWQKFTDRINKQTNVGTIRKLIQRATRRKTVTALHHSPGEYAEGLIYDWSSQSRVDSLSEHVQAALSAQARRRTLRLMGALLEQDDEDTTPFTEDELPWALAHGKATAPGDDSITYLSSSCSRKSQITLCYSSIIYVTGWGLCPALGRATSSYPFQSQAQTSSSQCPLLLASAR
ncbi:hypothetical protein E2C01_047169 [Portunus trituberculatus]|uniref:Uncharacterized protein n=1 Tax=Portunus trituberculatus TaxID=210409 RepID=A0A5B7FZQ1_PORTR|nr:hypothetical protein [Portunus trituberculatus]